MQPEPVGTVLSRLNGNGSHTAAHNDTRLADALAGRPRTLPELLRLFEAEEARENADVTVPLSSLRMNDVGLLEVPKVGAFSFTDWSTRQMANLTGVRLDRWFANASPKERADEMNRRFGRAREAVRLRTMKPASPGPGESQGADGVIRAFVTPSYAVMRDSAIAKTLLEFLGGVDHELKLLRYDLTDRSTSFVVAIGKPYRKGGPGKVGDVWGSLMVRNSGVGFASLLMTLFLVRLACTNGMTAPLSDALLLKKRHRGFQEGALLDDLREKARDLPGDLGRGMDRLLLSENRPVENIEAEVTTILQEHRLPRRLLPAVMAAYGREPLPSAFGVSQALTLAAHGLAPEERLELERAAGTYLAATS